MGSSKSIKKHLVKESLGYIKLKYRDMHGHTNGMKMLTTLMSTEVMQFGCPTHELRSKQDRN